jgi:hypothetical protein
VSVANLSPLPEYDRVAVPDGTLTQAWLDWFSDLVDAVDKAPLRRNNVSLTGQQASIGATNFSGGTIAAGLYRATYYARITQAATTSSSLTVTLGWTDGGVTPGYSGAAMTGNTTTTVQSGTFMLRADASTDINYSTTYASVGATPMQYSLYLWLEGLPT